MNHEKLKWTNEILVQASMDTGAVYGVKKCAEIVFRKGKMVRGEGLHILEERMKALDPDQNEVYKFLGCEQAEEIDTKKVMERVQKEVEQRTKNLVGLGLYDKNVVKAINCRVIPVVTYVMNVCTFSALQLDQLDKTIKRILRENNMHGRQCSDERLYLRRDIGGRGIKSFKDAYAETKVRVACYMAFSENIWIKEAWKREVRHEGISIKKEAEKALRKLNVNSEFREKGVSVDGDQLGGEWKSVWKKLKQMMKQKAEEARVEKYKTKKMQSEVYERLEGASHGWLKCNVEPKKAASIIEMQEQMVETKGWKVLRGIEVENDKCRLCGESKETVMHILSGCRVLAGTEYLRRHNNALMVLCVAWAKQEELLPKSTKWYKEKWTKGKVIENHNRKLCWDFEYNLRKTTTARRPDVTIEMREEKKIWLIDMACPSEYNVEEKHQEKLQKYQQLAFEIRERRPGYEVKILPVVIGCLGGGMERATRQVHQVITEEKQWNIVCNEMLKTVLFESESILRKTISGIAQGE